MPHDVNKDRDLPGALTTRATIFLRLRQSDRRPRELAWQEFRSRYAPIIAGFARKMGARMTEVDDVIQDVLLGFFAASPSFTYDSSRGRFRGYLKVCTFRALRDRLTKQSKIKTVALGEIDPASPEIDNVWNDIWEQELIRRALDHLRGEHKNSGAFRAFEQHAVLGRDAGEVARELGVEVNTVYKAKQRMIQALKARVDRLRDEEG